VIPTQDLGTILEQMDLRNKYDRAWNILNKEEGVKKADPIVKRINLWKVKSETRKDVTYEVVQEGPLGAYSCNCPDAQHRGGQVVCKHIMAVMIYEIKAGRMQ
jgi:SWIM zinc finger